ncbi:SDR family oxidoreductase [Arthrobacter sp. BPSS-3]|uniref:SDR family oxidoreductase n=1 Tax=Arthrobacter sp. BPSS-3 TaxID=3366580 RepID=UPI0037DC33E3
MSIVVTGATGHLGRLVLESLLRRGAPAGELVAVGRAVDKLDDFAGRGVQVRAMDYDDAGSVAAALKGASKVLLISGSAVGQRLEQHRTVIDAARAEGVELLAYTSIANADSTGMKLAAEHQATEKLLAESGLPHVLLRNGWYLENYTEQLPGTLAQGGFAGSAGDGKVSAAARADYADAAAAVLLADDQAGKVYELGGDQAFTMAELAAEISAAAGQPVAYQDLPAADYAAMLAGFGVPADFAGILADSDVGIARGDLLVTSGQLASLIGRPATTMPDAVRSAVAALKDAAPEHGTGNEADPAAK